MASKQALAYNCPERVSIEFDCKIGHFLVINEIHSKTRMHSSRMRTGRSLTVCWRLLPGGVCSGGVWSWGVSAPGGVCSQGVCSRGVSAPGGVSAPEGLLLGGLLGGSALGGLFLGGVCSQGVCSWGGLLLGGCSEGVVSQHALRQTPPHGQNHRCL